MYSEKTPDDGQRNCPKHLEFYSKNKFEKLVHLVGFIIRIYHVARSAERQKSTYIGHILFFILFKQRNSLEAASLYCQAQAWFFWHRDHFISGIGIRSISRNRPTGVIIYLIMKEEPVSKKPISTEKSRWKMINSSV